MAKTNRSGNGHPKTVPNRPIADRASGDQLVVDQTPAEMLRIRGARTHNLRNIDLDIPRDVLVVITGPSGSGKSSLAFDTIYAEGQRQYFESLSAYARQFLDQLERPDVDLIEGLQPTIAIDQRAGSHNPRSTVATVTEIYDYLRVLMARLGTPTCFQCGAAIRQQTPEQILDELSALGEGTKVMLLAPFVRGKKGAHAEVFESIRKAGFVRARVDGGVHDVERPPELARQKLHHIEAVVDRLVIREGIASRLAESIRLAVRHGDGLLLATYQTPASAGNGQTWQDRLFSTQYACPDCKLSYEELEPRTFSFNSPYGACPACQGLGTKEQFDPELVLPDETKSLADGAIAPWRKGKPAEQRRRKKQLAVFLEAAEVENDKPLAEWTPRQRQTLWEGDKLFPGLPQLLELERSAASTDEERERLTAFRGQVACPECGGARLRPEARGVRLGGLRIHDITAQTVTAAEQFFAGLSFTDVEAEVAARTVTEISARLEFLRQVGLDYLTLDRPADTLSGGESQRIRLATGIGSGLVGVCYVLDEPSIGLHPRDNERLLTALRNLQRLGNSVLVVEHDEAIIRRADWLFDMGPGAGIHGGQVVAAGTPADVMQSESSITGKYLAGMLAIPLPEKRRAVSMKRAIAVEGASTHNLKNLDVRFPLAALVCVTGVSGSGKSSLVNETLAKAVRRKLGLGGGKPGPHAAMRGAAQIDKLVEVDQSPIGRTPRSNPATYIGAFDEIRKVFTQTKEARIRGYRGGRFSFNVKGGRCEECQGQGTRKIEMNFLPDLYVTCPVCEGKRFNRQTLEVRYKGLSIAEVLALSVERAVEFFEAFPALRHMLATLAEVGLGYLTLGQASNTLSGGEAQRIKLAAELGRADTGSTLYILDEPTTGLHFDDVRKLLDVLQRLVDRGNTVIVIEHHLDVIKSADWLIDLGPEGGACGGYLLAEGTPEEIAALEGNETGRWLRPLFR